MACAPPTNGLPFIGCCARRPITKYTIYIVARLFVAERWTDFAPSVTCLAITYRELSISCGTAGMVVGGFTRRITRSDTGGVLLNYNRFTDERASNLSAGRDSYQCCPGYTVSNLNGEFRAQPFQGCGLIYIQQVITGATFANTLADAQFLIDRPMPGPALPGGQGCFEGVMDGNGGPLLANCTVSTVTTPPRDHGQLPTPDPFALYITNIVKEPLANSCGDFQKYHVHKSKLRAMIQGVYCVQNLDLQGMPIGVPQQLDAGPVEVPIDFGVPPTPFQAIYLGACNRAP